MNYKYPNILTILLVSPSNFQVIVANNIKNTYSYVMQEDDFGTKTIEEYLHIGYRHAIKLSSNAGKAWGRPQDLVYKIR